MRSWRRWRERRECWHHDPTTRESWIKHRLIETGMRKMFWCDRCGKTWFS